jgi:hypothetical protein
MGQSQSYPRRPKYGSPQWCEQFVEQQHKCIRTIKAASFSQLVAQRGSKDYGGAASCADLSNPSWSAKKYDKNRAALKNELLAAHRESIRHAQSMCGVAGARQRHRQPQRRPRSWLAVLFGSPAAAPRRRRR